MKNTPEKVTSELIDALVKLRKEQGLSHEKLADMAGLTRPAISYIENKKRIPTILTCLRICDALNVKMADLLKDCE